MSRLAVIVPVYNVEKLLPRCLDSILAQTFRDFTLILVNDGSTDGSGKICDEYAKKDERIRVIHKENGGVSSARNAGLDAADGEYITFIDSDDAIPQEYLETLYGAASGSGADIAVCDVVMINGEEETGRFSCKHSTMTGVEGLELLLSRREINSGPYAKLIKSKTISGIRFPKMKTYEDMIFNIAIFSNVQKIVNCHTEYHYIENSCGAMANDSKTPSLDVIKASEIITDFITKHPELSDKPFYATASLLMSYVYGVNNKPSSIDKTDFLNQSVAFFRQNRKMISKNKKFGFKEKIVYFLISHGILYHNRKLTKL